MHRREAWIALNEKQVGERLTQTRRWIALHANLFPEEVRGVFPDDLDRRLRSVRGVEVVDQNPNRAQRLFEQFLISPQERLFFLLYPERYGPPVLRARREWKLMAVVEELLDRANLDEQEGEILELLNGFQGGIHTLKQLKGTFHRSRQYILDKRNSGLSKLRWYTETHPEIGIQGYRCFPEGSIGRECGFDYERDVPADFLYQPVNYLPVDIRRRISSIPSELDLSEESIAAKAGLSQEVVSSVADRTLESLVDDQTTLNTLKRIGIYTIGELIRLDPPWIVGCRGIGLTRAVRLAEAVDNVLLEKLEKGKKPPVLRALIEALLKDKTKVITMDQVILVRNLGYQRAIRILAEFNPERFGDLVESAD